MKLIHKPTGQEIKEGSQFWWDDFFITVNHCPPPHKPSSEGKMIVIYPNGELSSEKYCSVFDCKWIEREDRQEQDALLQRALNYTPMTVKLQPALPAGEEQIPIVGAGKFHTIPSNLPCVNNSDRIIQAMKLIAQATVEEHECRNSDYGGMAMLRAEEEAKKTLEAPEEEHCKEYWPGESLG